jgi:D-alanine transaminase
MALVVLNGEFVPAEEARVSYEDRGYYFGDGVYEVFRVYRGRLFEPEAHLERLARSARAVSLALPRPLDDIAACVRRLCEANEVDTGIVYLQFTRGVAPRTHEFPDNASPVMMGFTKAMPRPTANMTNGITAMTAPDIRWLRCDIKSLNLLPNVLAKQQAKEAGYQEAIFHRDGTVTECTSSNVMMVKNGALYTHPANHLILHGITRAVVLRLAEAKGVPVREQAFTVQELAEADEAFITGTTSEITPIVAVDGRPVGDGKPGPVTRRLQEAFEAVIPR